MAVYNLVLANTLDQKCPAEPIAARACQRAGRSQLAGKLIAGKISRRRHLMAVGQSPRCFGRPAGWSTQSAAGLLLPQYFDTIGVIELCRARGKPVVVGGPGVLYGKANFQALGEAEGIIDKFIAASCQKQTFCVAVKNVVVPSRRRQPPSSSGGTVSASCSFVGGD
jgi:hypothetical protein